MLEVFPVSILDIEIIAFGTKPPPKIVRSFYNILSKFFEVWVLFGKCDPNRIFRKLNIGIGQ
jgi:hypothetical protein